MGLRRTGGGRLVGCLGAVVVLALFALLAPNAALADQPAMSPAFGITANGADPVVAVDAATPAASDARRYLAGPFDQQTVNRFVSDLAAVGVGVYIPGASGPVSAVGRPVSSLRLTLDQARAAALGAWSHAGQSGAALDGLGRPVKISSRRSLRLGLVIAAWAKRARTPSAALARRIIGRVNWERYRAVVFPNAVPLLFASDVAVHLRGGATAQYSAAVAGAAQAGPCSAVQSFITKTIDDLFKAIGHIRTDRAAVDRLFGRGFFGDIVKGIGDILSIGVNAVVDAAHRILLGGVRIATQVIANAVAGVAAVVGVIGSVAAELVPWAGTIAGSPNPTSKGMSVGVPGAFSLAVTAPGSAVQWPAFIADCAQTLGISLPTLTPHHADVTWDISNQSPGGLIVRKSDTGPLDANGTAKLGFETTTETPEQAKGALAIGTVGVTAKVHRRDLDELQGRLTQNLLAGLPKIVQDTIGPTLRAMLTPLINGATQKIGTVQDIEVAGVEAVRYHVPKPPKRGSKGKRPGKRKPRRHTENRYRLPNACSLLSLSDVAAAIHYDIVGPHAEPGGIGPYPHNYCGWHAHGAFFSGGVQVVTTGVVRFPDVATAKRLFSPTPGAITLAGPGDQAFYIPQVEQLHVRLANLWLVVSTVGGNRRLCEGLMHAVLSHLPAPARVLVRP